MSALIIFAKTPIEGFVKTRLAESAPLGAKEVTELYSAFLKDVISVAGKSSAERIILNYTPVEGEKIMREMAENFFPQKAFELVPQSGETFHAKITESFRYAQRYGPAVMIGSDSPALQARIIDGAFELLENGAEVVLGPAAEGGIYLIGLGKDVKPDFRAIFDGGSELLNFARQAEEGGHRLNLLEEVTDVDVAADLVSVVSVIEAMKSARNYQPMDFPENTARALAKLKIGIERRAGTREKVIVRDE